MIALTFSTNLASIYIISCGIVHGALGISKKGLILSDNVIGLHLYKISIRKNRVQDLVSFEKKLNGSDLQGYTDKFLENHAQNTSQNQSYAQNWYFEPRLNNENTRHGL